MTPENVTRYRVKAATGYYFIDGGHDRFDGGKRRAAILCERHANDLVGILTTLAPWSPPEKELYKGKTPCAICKRQGKL